MAIISIEGFKIYENENRRSLILESDRIPESMLFFSQKNLDGIDITDDYYKTSDLNFLHDYPFIKHLSISEGVFNIQGMYALPRLESLIISGAKHKIDFSNFTMLQELTADWSPYFLYLESCRHLTRLSLYGLKSQTHDLREIAGVHWIKSLNITRSQIRSLRGLDAFELRDLSLNYCSKLEELCCLEQSNNTLVTLLFDHCKAIKNHEYVIQLKNIKTLGFNDCGVLPSIKFIKKMSLLKDFRFVGTEIIDGDMNPCIGLRYAGFLYKKHYSHTPEQIKALYNAS